MTSLTALEARAIKRALAGPEPWKRQLRTQVDSLCVASRESTGAGFFVNLAHSETLGRVEIPSEAYSVPPQCFATHPDLPGGVFFLVWLRDGQIDFLEIASGTGTLPDETGYVFAEEE